MTKIAVLTTKCCPICVQLKQILKGKNIGFAEENVTTDAGKSMIKESGMKSLPILSIDGKYSCGMAAVEAAKELK